MTRNDPKRADELSDAVGGLVHKLRGMCDDAGDIANDAGYHAGSRVCRAMDGLVDAIEWLQAAADMLDESGIH